MFFDDYQKVLSDHLVKLQGNRAVIDDAAKAIAEAMKSGHYVFCSAIGHGIQGDFINRAGGLGNIRPFSWSFSVNNPMPTAGQNRPNPAGFKAEKEFARMAVRASNMREGDIFITGSVSGRNIAPIETALAAHDIGAKVIVMTSVDYAKQTKSLHDSGKSLYECADWVIDLMTPYGDSALMIPGYDGELVPLSGFAQVVSGWMLWGRVMEIMGTLPEEDRPAVFMSFNRAGGEEAYKKTWDKLNSRGY